jgi:TonB-linked SusC/RagA family outer membrane protein
MKIDKLCNKVLSIDFFFKIFPNRFLLMLNWVVILTFVLCIRVSAASYSQGIKVTMDIHEMQLKKAFNMLQQKGKIRLLYSDEDLSLEKGVSLSVQNTPALDALQMLLKNTGLKYQVFGDGLVVIVAPKTEVIQDINVKGQVRDIKGETLPGVSIKLKGTTIATTTDVQGRYSLNVPSKGALVFTFVGFVTQEVEINNLTTIDVTLKEEVKALNEIIVTALGIRRDKKALTYAVTEVAGESLTKAKEINLGNALAGKVAGVNATSTATGPSGSSRVIIRGNGSLNGNNQPLYVVNGVPINNDNQGSAGTYGGIDRGDGLISINPDDIESMSVLKGGTAAALYGSRAANGVILITTKSGKVQKGLGVEYNGNYTMDQPLNLTDWQYEYGSGSRGLAPTSQGEAIAFGRMSWGAKLDGSSVVQPDGVSRPYIAQKNNIKNFYNTGSTFSNTVALTGGTEAANFRFSASNLDNKGIVPNNSVNRKTFNLSANGVLAKKIQFEGKAQYNIEETKNRTFTADFQKNPNAGAQLVATNIDVRTLAPGVDAKGNEVVWSDYIYATNPYFAINKIVNGDTRRRFIGSFTTKYNITDAFYARARLGIDNSIISGFNVEPSGIAFNNQGSMTADKSTSYETNAEALLGFNKTYTHFSFNILAGGNKMYNSFDGTNFVSGPFSVPFQYFIGNGTAQTFTPVVSNYSIGSLFGSADIGYNNYLYLTLTGRNDWFSTLSIQNNNLFYPSAGLSFVFSEAWKTKPSWLSYGKVRASWAQVGGGAPSPYGLDLTYSNQAQQHLGGTLMTINGTIIPNKTLKPYTSTTSEFGIESKMFDSRLGLDVTVYDRSTTNDIVYASVPTSTGYSSVALNVGKIRNRGIELLLNGSPVRSSAFSWETSFNMAYNKNTVLKLADGLTSLFIPGATTRTLNGGIYHFQGMPYGMIAGNRALTNSDGQIVYNKATGTCSKCLSSIG